MNNKMVQSAKKFAVKHSGKVLASGIALSGLASQAVAMDATDIANGSALLSAGIAVTQTEPLGTIISMFALVIGALGFVKIVRRFY